MAALWYQNHLGGATRVLLITNDRENRRKAIEEGICAETSMLDVYLLLASLKASWYLPFGVLVMIMLSLSLSQVFYAIGLANLVNLFGLYS